MVKQSLRQDIRQKMRYIRKKQNIQQKYIAANRIMKQVTNNIKVKTAKKIALFISFDGEINTYPLIVNLLYNNKKVYIPKINNSTQLDNLIFHPYNMDTNLVKSKLGTLEPYTNITSLITIEELDILFVPLVSFDNYGHRLGMGGGFYDRILKNWHNTQCLPIGLAYDCQYLQQQTIPVEEWDISLPEIITPSNHWIWNHK